MSWDSLPVEIRLFIFADIVSASPELALNDELSATWRLQILHCFLVSKEWKSAITSQLVKITPVLPVLSVLGESVALQAIEYNIYSIADEPRSITRETETKRRNSTRDYTYQEWQESMSVGEPETKNIWLDIVIRRGFQSCVKPLLDAGADPNSYTANEDEQTPIQVALEYQKLEIAELLLDYGADTDFDDPIEGTHTRHMLLCAAAAENRFSLATKLLDQGAPPEMNRQDENPLCEALYEQNVEMAKLLIERGATFLNDENPRILPLYAAAKYNTVEVISMLIEMGADVNASDEDGNQAIDSSIPENEPVARLLVSKGAEVRRKHIRMAISQPPLMYHLIDSVGKDWAFQEALTAGAEMGKESLVRDLLKRGAEPEYLSLEAVSKGYVSIVRAFLDAGANPNTPSDLSGNSLYRAAQNGSAELVKLLLDKGVDVNFRTGRCQRAIQIAAYQGHEEIVKILLDRGADAVTHVGGDHGSAINAAIAAGHKNIELILREHGCARVAKFPTYGPG